MKINPMVEMTLALQSLIDFILDKKLPKHGEEMAEALLTMLTRGTVVVLPENGDIYRQGIDLPTQEEVDEWHLPYPQTLFLYSGNYGQGDMGNLQLSTYEQSDKLVSHLHMSKINGRWHPSRILCAMTYPFVTKPEGDRLAILSHGVDLGKAEKPVPVDPVSTLYIPFQYGLAMKAGATLKEQKITSFYHQEKMRKKGINPNSTYHVLEIPHSPGPVTGEGTHASPRFHFRRAHLRHYSSGKVSFVRHTFVGDPAEGVVHKDYEVK